jgi:hypothetical protein
VGVAPVESYRIPPDLFGTGDRHLSRFNRGGDHFEGITGICVIRLSTNGTWALSAQQVEGVNAEMSIPPPNGHRATGEVHFNIDRIRVAQGVHILTMLSALALTCSENFTDAVLHRGGLALMPPGSPPLLI